jgi:tetratricopeptide (TPR) repeat protein
MSAFAASPPVNPNLEQLMDEANALSAEGRDEQAYLLYQQVYERLLVTPGEDDPSTLKIMFNMGFSLLSQDRVVEAHSMLEKVLPKLVSVTGDEHPDTLMSMSGLAGTLYRLDRYDEALAMYETLLSRQVRILGEDDDFTLDTMTNMAWVLFYLNCVDDAHRTASRGLIIARKVGNEKATADFVELLSDLTKSAAER